MAKFVPQAELPVSEQAQIRRDKLAALQAEGRDPFLITKFDFNSSSAAIKADYDAFEVIANAGLDVQFQLLPDDEIKHWPAMKAKFDSME